MLVDAIAALKKKPQTREIDLEIQLLAVQRHLVDSYQIAEHYEYRARQLREAMLSQGASGGWSQAEVDEIEADNRAERSLPVPVCRHCGQDLA